ncbi:MAG: ParB/RepB/Spo0J family partition protein [Myxococcota bacterium]
MSVASNETETHPQEHTERSLMQLPLDRIEPNPEQPRKMFTQRQLDELVASIRAVGLIQPIVVRPTADGDRYQIVAGERRYRSFQILAQESEVYAAIPAVVQAYSDDDVQVAALVENVMRADLNPIERAEALRALKKQLRTHWKGVAERVGLSVRAVHFLTGMLKLRKEFRDAIAQNRLTEKHGRALRQLKNKEAQYDLFEYLINNPDLSGSRAIAIAAVMKKYASYTAEEAHRYLEDEQHKDELPSPRTGPPITPAVRLMRGLKMFNASAAADVELQGLSDLERQELMALVEETRRQLNRLVQSLSD